MNIIADLRRLENENKLLSNLLHYSHETAANLRKIVTEMCPLLKYVKGLGL